jgi:hypothetical protein
MKLTAKKLKHWLFCITQTARFEELPYPDPQHEPLSFKARDEKTEKAKGRAK